MNKVMIVGASRTPLGHFLGNLSQYQAFELAGFCIKKVLNDLPELTLEEVIFGNVYGAGLGQNPAKRAASLAGVPFSIPAMNVNKMCGSGLQAVGLGMQALKGGQRDVVLVGGMESMSNAPFLLSSALRKGCKNGDLKALDALLLDGLWDPYEKQSMGNLAELCIRDHGFSRESLDAFAVQSFQRAQYAQSQHFFDAEITSIQKDHGLEDTEWIQEDEGPKKAKFDKIPKLKPVFQPQGFLTAANSSPMSDGAACLVLASEAMSQKKNVKPLGELLHFESFSYEPKFYTSAPVHVIQRTLQKLSWSVSEVDFFEINEAFAPVPLIAMERLKIPLQKINVWGGALALGHPLGASGARILVTLLSILKHHQAKRGIAALCIGGGEAVCVAVQTL